MGQEEIKGERKDAAEEAAEIRRSMSLRELRKDPCRKIDFIVARPRMALYVDYSMRIYEIYLKYISPEDIFAYSIDEVFIELTPYLKIYGIAPKELVRRMLLDVYSDTGITATAGIGTNLYLSKIAMDIVAKRCKADENGTRIAFLDVPTFRSTLWEHLPLTDFWSIGRGTAKKLNEHGLYTVGDIARCSIGDQRAYYNADLLYRLFGVNAELLIDHAWGLEPVTLKDVKSYIPSARSLSSGQVLTQAYTHDMARIVITEMAEKMALDLMEKNYSTSGLVISVGYDVINEKESAKEMETDAYGRAKPVRGHGSIRIDPPTNLATRLIQAALELYDRITKKHLWIRRLNIAAVRLEPYLDEAYKTGFQAYFDTMAEDAEIQKQRRQREDRLQQAILHIKKKYGKNAILRGCSFQKGATSRSRNEQIGGHKA